ncbi:MAG: hypothetical protein NTY19_46830 [Planctomycetota bacterium]|nr:hypothetical protein [Planctomycetota bacterium]
MELKPLPYHELLCDYLRTEEAEVWRWYTSHQVRAEQAEAVRFELLKSTYRVARESQPAIYAAAESVAKTFGLEVPITIYQAQNPQGLNASLACVPDEALLTLHGPVTAKLTESELCALLGHEFSHLLLWRYGGGEYLILEQLLAALTHDPQAGTPHFASARLWQLYSEIFCDRGALAAVGDPLVVVAMLLKVHTQLAEVSAESYLRQAEEVLSRGGVRTAESTHPEAFIRTHAIQLWSTADPAAEAKIRDLIEGRPVLDNLDLLGQQRVVGLTRRLLDVHLSHRWLQTELVLAHARRFFEDYVPPSDPLADPSLAEDLRTDDPALQDYYCFVLLDFVTADRDLEELPLAAALVLSETLGLRERFGEMVKRELRLRKKQFEKIDADKERLLAEASKDSHSQ